MWFQIHYAIHLDDGLQIGTWLFISPRALRNIIHAFLKLYQQDGGARDKTCADRTGGLGVEVTTYFSKTILYRIRGGKTSCRYIQCLNWKIIYHMWGDAVE